MTRLSCHRFRSNEVRLWLTMIAYDFGNLWRRLVLPQRIGNWSLTSLQQQLVKTGGRFLGPGRGRLGAGGTGWDRRSRLEASGCVLATAGGQEPNSSLHPFAALDSVREGL